MAVEVMKEINFIGTKHEAFCLDLLSLHGFLNSKHDLEGIHVVALPRLQVHKPTSLSLSI